MSGQLSACTYSVYQALFPPPPHAWIPGYILHVFLWIFFLHTGEIAAPLDAEYDVATHLIWTPQESVTEGKFFKVVLMIIT